MEAVPEDSGGPLGPEGELFRGVRRSGREQLCPDPGPDAGGCAAGRGGTDAGEFRQPGFGTVQRGRLADMVLLQSGSPESLVQAGVDRQAGRAKRALPSLRDDRQSQSERKDAGAIPVHVLRRVL